MILMVITQLAGATPTMRVSDGSLANTFTVVDNTPADGSTVAGVVVFSGTFGNWIITVNTGVTMPAAGSATSPFMDLNFIATSNSNGGTLTIEFSEIGFGPMAAGLNYEILIGGTTQGTVACTTLADVSDSLFGVPSGASIGSQTFSGGAFAREIGAPGTNSSPFSLTKRVTITHLRGGIRTSSGDTQIAVPDGGATVALFGVSLLGLGALRRKFSKG
ncbi:MAG: motif [Verrucomicrobiota bacterium]